MKHSRRDFIRTALIAPGVLAGLNGCVSMMGSPGRSLDSDPWDRVPDILRRIVAPSFPAHDVSILAHGARGDGTTDCTAAFREAISACNAAGGGRVVVPAGKYLTGAIHLRSNVNLHLQEGATILFSRDPRAYLPVVLTRFEGTELMGYSPLIYAFEQENVAVTGAGTLDGQANRDFWWPWKGSATYGFKAGGNQQQPARDRLVQMAEDGVPVASRVFGEGSFLRPAFIEPYRCRNVLIEGVTIINSPMWELHPTLCTNVTVRNVTISTHGPNNDGCDPESCRDVLIEGCTFDTGDDCIAIKSGRNADGRRLKTPTENVIVRNCTMKDGHGGVTIGSEISGDVRWVFTENCRMDSPQLERALRLKNNASRGGVLEHIYMRDVTIGQVSDSIVSVDFTYEEGAKGAFTPVARDINVQRVTSGKSKYGVFLRGFENAPITNITLTDCRFDNVASGNVLEHVQGYKFTNVLINGKPA